MDIFSSHRDVELVIAFAALHVMFCEYKFLFCMHELLCKYVLKAIKITFIQTLVGIATPQLGLTDQYKIISL